MRRLRPVVLGFTALALLPALAAFLVAVALRTPWVQTELRSRLAGALADALGARVSIGRLRGTLLAGARATDVRIALPNGARLVVDDLSATYALPALLAGRFQIGTLRLRGVDARLIHTADGWGLAGSPDTPESAPAPASTVVIRRIVLEDGRIAIADLHAAPPRRLALTHVGLDASFSLTGSGVVAKIVRLDATPRGVAVTPFTLHGTIAASPDGTVVRLADVELKTRRMLLATAGQIAGGRIAAHLQAAPLSARELHAIVPEVSLASDVSGTITARGRWRRLGIRAALHTATAGRLRLFGVVDAGATPPRWTATARTRQLDLAGVVSTLPATRLTGRLRGRGALTALDPPLRLRVQLTPSTVTGVALDATRVLARVGPDGLAARGTVATAAGRATIDGTLSWAADPVAYQANTRARIVTLAALAPGLSGDGRIVLRVDGRGVDAVARSATARIQFRDGHLAGTPVDEAAADLTLRGNTLQIVAGNASVRGLALTTTGTIGLADATIDGAATVTGDVAGVAAARGIDAAGRTTARATARGPLTGLAVDATAAFDGLRIGTRTLRHGGVTAALNGLGGSAPAGRATVDLDALAVSGAAPWTGSVGLDWRRAAGADVAAVTLQGRSADGARLVTRGTVTRQPASGALEAQLAELAFAPRDQPAWRLESPARVALTPDGTVATEGLVLVAGSQRLRAAGRAGRTGPADAALAWESLDLAAACRLRGLACSGRSGGTIRLTGTAAAPRLAIGARADGLAVAGSPAATLRVTGDYSERTLRARGTIAQADAGSLDLAAILPIDLAWDGPQGVGGSRPLELALETDGLDLRMLRLLAPDAVRRSAGRLTATLRVTGPWPDVRADGVVRVAGGQLALAATGVTWEGIELRAVARGDRLVLETLAARGGNGTLEGRGTMALAASRTTPFAVQLAFRDFLAISRPAYEAATDGTLTVEGALAYPVIRGALTLTRLLVRPALLEQESAVRLEPDPTITVVGLPDAPATEGAPPIPLADALSLDVRVGITRDAWLRRADADVELRGDLHLAKAAYNPLYVLGEIRLVRGWYAFQGRRFAVEDSRITFGGESPPDPQLDIRALHRTRDYEVTVRITGRATQPALALSSQPALAQADILALLVFGRPARELGAEQGVDLQRQALSLASGYVAPELRESVMEALNLDTFELSDQTVSAGRYITRDVFVTLAQDLTGRAGQLVGVEYAITPRLSVKMSTSTQGNSAVDVLWRRRY